jgi:formate dehydrogenase gamma subunit
VEIKFKVFPVMFIRAAITVGLLILTAGSSSLWAQSISNDTCMMCHGRKGSGIPAVDMERLAHSAHGQIRCILCHPDAGSMPHPKKLASVSCERCHKEQSEAYLGSRHGRIAKRDRSVAAVCSDCHGMGHTILKSDNPDSPVNRRHIVETCAHCHEDTERMAFVRLSVKDPVRSYRQTVHWNAFEEGNIEAAVCTDCHGTHALYNSLNPAGRIFKRNIPDTCGSCHKDIAEEYIESVHGQAALNGVAESPVCTDCHGSHTIRSSKESGLSASTGAITHVCSDCHESELLAVKFNLPTDRLETYSNSYHGLAARRGDLTVANCASCHGYHDVMRSTDPRSSVYKSNLSETCGQCHPGAGDVLSSGKFHGSPESKHWTLMAIQWFYWIVIPVALGAMLLHNGLDWARKAWSGVPATVHPDDIRFTVNERWQHFILISSFVLLALSGFALKYPDAIWADYLAPSEEAVRRNLHRWGALVFTLLSVYHFFYIVLTKRGRFILREMNPRWADIKNLIQVLGYNLHIRKSPPAHESFYRYPEKIEYWSLVWGSILMIVTGSVLVFNNVTLKYFPLWVSDLATLAHYYEAILACLAILVWHFYAVIFDPDVYPMNRAWWSGRIGRSDRNLPGDGKNYFKRIPYGRF